MKNSAAWTDFVVCILFGWVGAHKFREKNVGMGILYLFTFGLFGFGWIIDSIRYLMAALKGERIQGNKTATYDPNAPLPVVNATNIILFNGEVCHYCSAATYVKTKNVVVGYSGGSQGVSIRVAKGMSYRVGASKAAPVRGNVEERTNGLLSITNKRIVFSGAKGAFDKKLTALSSVTPYKNAIDFQFGTQSFSLETKQSEIIYSILARIINSINEDEI